MKYTISIYCPDCYLEDYLGCFDGHFETYDPELEGKEPILTIDRAFEIGYEKIRKTIWDFWVNVIDDNGEEIDQIEEMGIYGRVSRRTSTTNQ